MKITKDNKVTFRKGDYILQQGDDTGNAYMIIEGEAEIFLCDKTGRYSHVAYIGPHQTVGEMVLIDNEPCYISAIATTYTVCRVMSTEHLDETLQGSDAFVVSLLKLMTSRYRSLLEDYYDKDKG